MVAPTASGGLVLSPAQRVLVEKSLAARRTKDETRAIERIVESAAQRHIEETKARCRQAAHSKSDPRNALILRHVGEQLASVAKRELLQDPHKRAARSSKLAAGNCASAGVDATNASDAAKSLSASAGDTSDATDDDGDDRFGPVRRPPRVRPPNLWVSVYAQEQADVQRELDAARRKRLDDAAHYRDALAQQEHSKRLQQQHERAAADAYAQQQKQQVAAYQALERERQREQHNAMVDEAQRCRLELAATQQQQLAIQQQRAQSELRAVERTAKQLALDAQRKEQCKQQQQREMALVQHANALQLQRKRDDAARAQVDERQLQAAYERTLEQQEAQRERALQLIVERQSQRVKLALLHVPSAEERAREDEARAVAHQQQLRAKEDAELQSRAVRQQQQRNTHMQALRVQQAERRSRFAREQADDDAYARTCQRELAVWQQQQRSTQLAVRERNRANQELVQRQMQLDGARRASDDKYGMSCEEMALNAALLRHAGVTELPTDAQRTRHA